MVRPGLLIVIPCHNEASTLGDVVSGAARFGEVLVVDDRSTDASRETASRRGARLMAAAAPGYDGALETGLSEAFVQGYAHVVTMDADGEHDPACLEAFVSEFEAGAALVCGYRPRPQRAAEHVAAVAGLALFGVRDLLCGMKGYSRPVLAAYFESGAPLLVNMAPAVLWFRRGGGSTAQVAVTGRMRCGSPRFGRVLAANLAILRALWRVVRLPSRAGGRQPRSPEPTTP